MKLGNLIRIKLCSFLVLLAMVHLAHPVNADVKAREATYEDGAVMFNNKEYQLAIPYYEEVIKANGNEEVDAKALYYLAESHFRLENYKKAAPIYRDYLIRFKQHKLRTRAQFRFAEALYFQEDYETAAAAFERFVSDNPQDELVPESLYRSATSLLEIGRSAEASKLLEKLKKDHPTHPKVQEALFYMAWADFRDDRFDAAAENFYQYYKKFPNSDKAVESLLRSANAYFSATKYKRALELYNEVLRMGQGAFEGDSNTGIAWSYYKLEEFDKAGNYFMTLARSGESVDAMAEHYYQAIHSFYSGKAWDKGIQAVGEFLSKVKEHQLIGDAYYWRGLIYVQKNEFANAEQDLLKASGFKGTKITQGEIYLELGNLYFKKEQSDKAVETLKKGLQIAKKPDVAQQLRYEISRMLHQLGRTSEAISFMEENLKNLASSEDEVALLSKFSMAEFQFAQKDYDSALRYYDNVIQSDHRELKLDALYKKAWCYRFLKNLDAALKTFDELHVLDSKGKPKYGQEVPYLIAQVHQEAGSASKAREWYTKVVVNNEDYAAESTLALAEIDFELGKFEDVIKHAKGFLVSYQKHKLEPNVRFLIAESAYEQGDVKLAQDNYRRIIDNKQAVNREDALYGSAWLLYENGEHDQALKDINTLLTDFKETSYKKSAIQLKSNILRQLDRLEEARDVLNLGMKHIKDEDGESILLDLAKIESDLNRPEKALEIYNKLLKDYPDTKLRGMVTYEKGWLYMSMEKPNEAFLMFKAYEQSHPDGEFIHDVQFAMGQLAYDKGKFAESLAYYEKSRVSDLYKDGSLYYMAWSHFELGNHKASAEAFSALVKECPESSLMMESLYREGQSWLKALEFDKALKALEHYVERGKADPFYGDALSDLGRVYEKKEMSDKAYDVYETYLKLFPTGEQSVPVSFRLGKLAMQSDKFVQAREYFQKVLENASHSLAPESQFLEGECFYSEGRYTEAIGAFLKTEKFAFGEQWQAAALFKIAKSHKMLKNTPRAKEYLEKLMSRFPKSDYTGKAMEELRKLN